METARLHLAVFTRDMMFALMSNRAAFKEMIGVHVPDSWPGPDVEEALAFIAESTPAGPEGVLTRAIIDKDSNTSIGVIGFKGPPDEKGTIEIGYNIIPEYQGQGYATEAARAMCEWATRQPGVQRIVAETLKDGYASQRVLEKAGFLLVGEAEGLLHWEREGPKDESSYI